jgi:hypothetical protein
MKDYLADLVRSAPTPLMARNMAREYLQARILGSLQSAGAMIPLAFHGGTALGFLFSTARYSEDLDFALEKDRDRYNFRAYLRSIQRDLAAEAYKVDIKLNDQKTVHSAFIRFPGLLFEFALSPHADEVLSVKLEVDTNPPAGAGLATTVIRRHVPLQIHHHDRPSLLAGKIHAILQRSFTKGRDLYDLLWYLSDPAWPPPNFLLLNHALAQTGWPGETLADSNWRAVLRERLQNLDWSAVLNDVRPFIESGVNVEILTRENLLNLLEQR